MGNENSKKSRKSQVFEIVDDCDNTILEGIIPITVSDVGKVPCSVTHEHAVIIKTEPPDPAEITTNKENGVLAVDKTETLNDVNEQLNDITITGSTPSKDGVEAEIDNTNSTANVIDTETNDEYAVSQESAETNDLKTDEEISKQDPQLESNTPEITNETEISNETDEKIKVKSNGNKKSKKEKEPKKEKELKKKEKHSRKESKLSTILSIKRKEQKDKTEIQSEVNYVPCHEHVDTETVQRDAEIAVDVPDITQHVEAEGTPTEDEIGVSMDTNQICTGENSHKLSRKESRLSKIFSIKRKEQKDKTEIQSEVNYVPCHEHVDTETVQKDAEIAVDVQYITQHVETEGKPIEDEIGVSMDTNQICTGENSHKLSRKESKLSKIFSIKRKEQKDKTEIQSEVNYVPCHEHVDTETVQKDAEIAVDVQDITQHVETEGKPIEDEIGVSMDTNQICTGENSHKLSRKESKLSKIFSIKRKEQKYKTEIQSEVNYVPCHEHVDTETVQKDSEIAVDVQDITQHVEADGKPTEDEIGVSMDTNQICTGENSHKLSRKESRLSKIFSIKRKEQKDKTEIQSEVNYVPCHEHVDTETVQKDAEIAVDVQYITQHVETEGKPIEDEIGVSMDTNQICTGENSHKLSRKESKLSKIFSIKRKEQKDKTEIQSEVNYVPCHEHVDTETVQKDAEIAVDVQDITQHVETEGKPIEDEIGVSMDTNQICTGENSHKLSRKESKLSKIFSIKRKEQKDKTEIQSEVNYVPCHEHVDTETVQKDSEIAVDVQDITQNVETEGKPTEDEIGVSMDTNQICTGENSHKLSRKGSKLSKIFSIKRKEQKDKTEIQSEVNYVPCHEHVDTETVQKDAEIAVDVQDITQHVETEGKPIEDEIGVSMDTNQICTGENSHKLSRKESKLSKIFSIKRKEQKDKTEIQSEVNYVPCHEHVDTETVQKDAEIAVDVQDITQHVETEGKPTEDEIGVSMDTNQICTGENSHKLSRKGSKLSKMFSIKRKEQKYKTEIQSEVNHVPCHEHVDTETVQTDAEIAVDVQDITQNVETEGKPTEDEIGVSMDTNQICTGENSHKLSRKESKLSKIFSIKRKEQKDKTEIQSEVNYVPCHEHVDTETVQTDAEIAVDVQDITQHVETEGKPTEDEIGVSMDTNQICTGENSHKLSRKGSKLSKMFSIKRKEQKYKTEIQSEVNYVPCHEHVDTETVQTDAEIAVDVQDITQNVETEGKPTEDEIGVSMDTNQICTGENAHNTIGIAQIDYDDSSECKSKGYENVTKLESEGIVENQLVISNEPDKVHSTIPTENVRDNDKPDAINTTIDTDKSSPANKNYLQETFDLINAAEIPMPSFSSQETSSPDNGCDNLTLSITTTKEEFQLPSGLSHSNDLPKDDSRNDEISKSTQSTDKNEIMSATIETPETIETPGPIETPETIESPKTLPVLSSSVVDRVCTNNTIDYDTINSTASANDHITSTGDSGESQQVVNGRVDLDVNEAVEINTEKQTDISIATTVSVEDKVNGNVIADNASLETPKVGQDNLNENVNGTQNEALNAVSENIEMNPTDQSKNMAINESCEDQIQKTNMKENEKRKNKEKGTKEIEKMNEPEVPLAEVTSENTGNVVHTLIKKFEERNVQKKKEKISPKKKKSKGGDLEMIHDATINHTSTADITEEQMKERKMPVSKSSSKSDKDKKAKKKKKEKKEKSSTLQNKIVISAPVLSIFDDVPAEIEVNADDVVSLSSLSSDEKETSKATNQVKVLDIKIEENNLTHTSTNHNLLSVHSSLATSRPKSDEYVTLFVNKEGSQSENIEINGQLDDTVASLKQTSETSTEVKLENAQPEVDSNVEVSSVNDSKVDVAVDVTVKINGELNDTGVDDADEKNILPICPENGIVQSEMSTPITDNDATLHESPQNNKSSPKKKSKNASKKKEGRPKLSIFRQSSSEVSGTKRNTASRHVSFEQDPQNDSSEERRRSFSEYLRPVFGNIFSKSSPTSESKKKSKKVKTPDK